MADLDLAGVLGTWVGVGLGLLALLGIIGPFLVIRAARDEKHQAISNVGRSNNDYITSGTPVWPGIRFWQRIQAPKLEKPRMFQANEWHTFDIKRTSGSFESPATWVQFGAYLQAYGMNYETADSLTIANKKSLLPVHWIYLYVFCIAGRFSREHLRSPVSPQTGPRAHRTSLRPTGTANRRTGDRGLRVSQIHPLYRDAVIDVLNPGPLILYGLSGKIKLQRDREDPGNPLSKCVKVEFVGAIDDTALELIADRLSPAELIIIAEGFLPAPGGAYISLVNQFDDEGYGNSDDGSIYSLAGGPRKSRPRRSRHFRPPLDSEATHERVASREYLALDLQEVRMENEVLSYLPKTNNAKFYAFQPTRLVAQLSATLEELVRIPYVPASEPWVRVASYGRRQPDTFFRRSDAQKLALALILMDWHPQAYLLRGLPPEDHVAYELSSAAADYTIHLLQRLKENARSFGWTRVDEHNFVALTEAVLKKPFSSFRLYKLDELLSKVLNQSRPFDQMVGVLTLTNEEFRAQLYRSTHHLAMSLQSSTDVDVSTGRIEIAGAFNVTQTFEVDPSILSLLLGRLGTGVVSVKHAVVLTAAVRACLRSLMLTTCVDSGDLTEIFERLMNEEEVLLVR